MSGRSARSRSGEIRIERCHYGVLHAPRQLQCAGLVPRQGLGEIGGMTNIDPERAQPVCILKSIGECGVNRPQQKQKAPNDVRFRELRLVPGKERLQVLLDGLLSVKDDDVPEFRLRRKADGGAEVEMRLLDPFGNQAAS